MTTADEQSFTSLLQEKPFVEESADVKIDNKWELQLTSMNFSIVGPTGQYRERHGEFSLSQFLMLLRYLP
jgi:hypothetical protein